MKIAQWLRKSSNLGTGEGLLHQHRRRIDYFCGEDLKLALTSAKFKKKNLFKTAVGQKELTDADYDEIGTRLLQSRHMFRGVITNLDTADLEDLDVIAPHSAQHFVDGDSEIYVWILKPSARELYAKAAMLVVFALFICMIKIWPLWLKIIVWWISLIMLICMLSLIVIRLILAALFVVVGFKGIWLLPNLLNDDVDILDAFSPLFGRGIDMKAYQLAQLERVAARRRRRGGKEDKKKAKKEASEDDDAPKDCDPEMSEEEVWRVSLINISVIAICGMIICNYFGLFMPDNIPDFVVSQVELWKEFPSLAPPDFDADVLKAEEEAKNKKPSLDDLLKEEEEEAKKAAEGVEEEEEYKPDPILDRVDDEDGEFADLDLPDVPDDDEE